ncbi:MAG: Smr/MutS family protein [Candidatus Marinimicrobia bacterium]|nr:Smr/MutS family protein [Candidatus Neomarinimicrobiota bacterium]MBL7022895.1 Smr/MutS family protein [Candidatus Neomarinimicrobiota bacterium]MBL7109214.1 Smr/MutS family protein [Candidatus Neomarinimicrobiota bacterium]
MKLSDSLKADVGFNLIIDWLTERCHNSLSKEQVQSLVPTTKREFIQDTQSRTEELLNSLIRGEQIPLQDFPDISIWIELLQTEGSQLTTEQFTELNDILVLSRQIRHFTKSDKFPVWREIGGNLLELESGEKEISRVFDESFQIKSSASPELAQIRKKIISAESAIHKRMQDIFSNALNENWLQDNRIVWQEGRLVLPMKSSNKRKVKGIVHGSSSTGQTSYVEPLEIIERTNDLTEFRIDEKAEIHRILTKLTTYFRPYYEDIFLSFHTIVSFDVHLSYAKLAKFLDATKPIISQRGDFILENAKNPVLIFKGVDVIPLNCKLPKNKRILLISGPNAGGKTVVLKTVGLLSILSQCGLFVPVKRAIMPIYDCVVADIGDRQSIENDLSTFSAHIQNLKRIIEVSNDRTLILLDELGTGTEPDAGASISQALLENLIEKKSTVIATTHLGLLKIWAHDEKGILNGGMVFDSNALSPTYELNVGMPGSSYAIEISTKIGLQKSIIKRATELIGDTSVELEKLLNDMESQRLSSTKLEENLKAREIVIKNKEDKIYHLQLEIEKTHKHAKKDAIIEAREIVAESRRDIENLVYLIKKKQADSTAIKTAKNALKAKLHRLENDLKSFEEPIRNHIQPNEAKKGVKVFIPHLEESGEIIYPLDKQNKVTVEVNGIKLKLSYEQLILEQQKISQNSTGISGGVHHYSGPQSMQIDLRGKRVDEAIEEVDQFLDKALLAGLSSVNILHGKGTGALQEAIQSHLKTLFFVKSYQFAKPEFGGAGITVVEM